MTSKPRFFRILGAVLLATGFFAGGFTIARATNHITIEITARPGFVQRGQSTVLTWTTRNAVGCRAERDWNGDRPIAGSQIITPEKALSIYRLACWDAANETVTSQIAVERIDLGTQTTPSPVVFTSDRTTISRGMRARLSWNAPDATLCTARTMFDTLDGVPADVVRQWSSSDFAKTGAVDVSPTVSAQYILECSRAQLTTSKMIRVIVSDSPGPQENFAADVPVVFTASQAIIPRGESIVLGWNTQAGTQCTASSALSSSSEGTPALPAVGWSGAKEVSGTAQVIVSEAARYSLRCVRPDQKSWTEQSIAILTTPSPTPNVIMPSLTASAVASSIIEGQSSSVTWNAENAVGCSVASPPNDRWFGFINTMGSVSLAPIVTTVYRVRCWNRVGVEDTRNLTITVSQEQEIDLAFTPSADFIMPGESVTLSWTGTNARTCTAEGSWFGAKQPQGGETVTPAATTTYTLTCAAGSKTAKKSVTVRVGSRMNPSRVPTLSFSVDKRAMPQGSSALLVWRAENVSHCSSESVFLEQDGTPTKKTIRDEWGSPNRPSIGEAIVGPIMDTLYRMTCSGEGMTLLKKVKVTVSALNEIPSGGAVGVDLQFTATPPLVTQGKQTILRWHSAKATACTASGAWNGERSLESFDGMLVTVGKHSEYRLTCSNDFGFSTSVALTVASQEPPQGFYALPSSVLEVVSSTVAGRPGATTLRWSSMAAADCSASGAKEWIGYRPVWGVAEISPAASSTYSLDCWNTVGTLAKRSSVSFGGASSTSPSTAPSSTPAATPAATTPPVASQPASMTHTPQSTTAPAASTLSQDWVTSVRESAIVTSAEALSDIPLAPYNMKGTSDDDADGDGLSDRFEAAIGTDPLDPDSDGDGYGDRLEVISGYPPFQKAAYRKSEIYSLKGKVVRPADREELWYVNARNGKRYLLISEGDLKHARAKGVSKQKKPKKR